MNIEEITAMCPTAALPAQQITVVTEGERHAAAAAAAAAAVAVAVRAAAGGGPWGGLTLSCRRLERERGDYRLPSWAAAVEAGGEVAGQRKGWGRRRSRFHWSGRRAKLVYKSGIWGEIPGRPLSS